MDHLLQASVRSLVLAAVAALGLWRVKSASTRHAVWTLVMASMLVQLMLSPLLPRLPLQVLHSAEPVTSQVISVTQAPPTPMSQPALPWAQVAAGVYLCGLLFFVARLTVA